jgi:hypothetical protein
MELGNSLGTFIEADMSFLEMGKMVVAQNLVSLDIREGLVEDLKLVSHGKAHKQKLNHEGVPFHCR